LIQSPSFARVNFRAKLVTASFTSIILVRKLSYELSTEILGSKTGISFGDIKMFASSARCVQPGNALESARRGQAFDYGIHRG
jgi:hypothetical protein